MDEESEEEGGCIAVVGRHLGGFLVVAGPPLLVWVSDECLGIAACGMETGPAGVAQLVGVGLILVWAVVRLRCVSRQTACDADILKVVPDR